MSTRRKRIGDLLLDGGLISAEQLSSALASQRETHARLGRILVHQGVVSEEQLLETLASLHDTKVWDLLEEPPSEVALTCLLVASCARFCVLPVRIKGDDLTLAMTDVDDVEAIDHVALETGLRVVPVLASERQILAKIEELKDISGDSRLVEQALEIVSGSAHEDENFEQITEKDTAPVMILVNQVILDAIQRRASDVHIEPCRGNVDVRMRVDGMLQTVRTFPANLLPMVVARIKIMAELDISVRRQPQDGRFNVRLVGKSIDVRMSVLPTHYGERVVMRILDGSVADRGLNEIGFSLPTVELFNELIRRPYGLVLVTGPTGSGKTTTLYAALNALKDPCRNIMTCEDPIEYDVNGIAQSQVNERGGLTFATQLRAILRQDPDVVLVGEIRDQETAEIAMRASMTGHLVMSTLHCNDAISALPRLYDMGIQPFLLSTSLVGVLAQRLVRILCTDCREEVEPSEPDLALWRLTAGPRGLLNKTYRAVGCPKCYNTGYKGRVGVGEIIPVNLEMAAMIASGASMDAMMVLAKDLGFRSMQSEVIARVSEGVTSFEEARRVVAFDAVNPKKARQAA
jgi:type IV pilus assembly protein PilB